MEAFKTCKSCEIKLPSEARFCSNCGAPLEMLNEKAAKQELVPRPKVASSTSTSTSSSTTFEEDDFIAGRFRVGTHLGEGSYGSVYSGHDEVGSRPVALKLESVCGKQLRYEFELLCHINAQLQQGLPPPGKAASPPARWKETKVPDSDNFIEAPLRTEGTTEGIPAVFWYGGHGSHKVLALEQVGPNLGSMIGRRRSPLWCGEKLSLRTVLMVGVQMVSRIETLHRCGVLHRDVKPENFCLGPRGQEDVIYVLDFGLSKPWVEGDNVHIPVHQGQKSLCGTARFASITTHDGFEQSRRDDLECLAYVLVFLMMGSLPWQGGVYTDATDKKKRNRLIGDKKKETPLLELCNGVPELESFTKYCRTLRFTAEPDYEYLRGLLHAALERNGWELDADYDWKRV